MEKTVGIFHTRVKTGRFSMIFYHKGIIFGKSGRICPFSTIEKIAAAVERGESRTAKQNFSLLSSFSSGLAACGIPLLFGMDLHILFAFPPGWVESLWEISGRGFPF